MAQIRISILDQIGGRKIVVEAPNDVPINQLIPALVTNMNLPLQQGGNPISYRLDDPDTEARISYEATLEEAGVKAGAILSLTPEVTAGRG